PSRPHPLRMMVETRLANMGLKPTIGLEVDAVATIVQLVSQGEGYAIVTRHPVAISDARDNLLMRRIVAPRMISVLALATSAERPLTTLGLRTPELPQGLRGDGQPSHASAPRGKARGML